MEIKYQEIGPKGPLWEEISSEMRRLGHNRSAKRCKEKWENINKYFKKVKESNKRRPEDSKTCPYFHQLDALYRRKRTPAAMDGGTASLDDGGTTSSKVNFMELHFSLSMFSIWLISVMCAGRRGCDGVDQ